MTQGDRHALEKPFQRHRKNESAMFNENADTHTGGPGHQRCKGVRMQAKRMQILIVVAMQTAFDPTCQTGLSVCRLAQQTRREYMYIWLPWQHHLFKLAASSTV